jgi:ferredoxin
LISDDTIQPATAQPRYTDVEEFMKKTPEERMAYWREELSRCVKCYACRQACPLCYCQRCIVEKNRPQCISTSATLKGNFAYHIARAFHQAGRCIGCDECTRVCPAGINLRLLNLSLAKAAEEKFSYRSGVDPESAPLIGCYSENDKETFIQ